MWCNSSDFYADLFKVSREQPQQDVYLHTGFGEVLIAQNPLSIEHILRHNVANYPKRYDWFRQSIGISRFTENPPLWQELKQITQPFLNDFDKNRLVAEAKAVVDENMMALQATTINAQTRLNESVLRHLAIDIFCRTFFDFRLETIDFNFDLFKDLLEISTQYAFVPRGKIRELLGQEGLQDLYRLRVQILQGLGQFRDTKYQGSDLMQRIAQADAEGKVILEHEMLMLFSIGIETTVHTLGWIVYVLSKYPDVQAQLRSEADEYTIDANGHAQYQNLLKIPCFIDWVLKQYPPTPCISREAIHADTIGKLKVAEKEAVILSLMGMMYDPEETLEKALSQDNMDLQRNMAFGSGQRICGGKHYATLELVVLVAEFLKRFNITLLLDEDVVFHWNAQLNREGGHPVVLQAIA